MSVGCEIGRGKAVRSRAEGEERVWGRRGIGYRVSGVGFRWERSGSKRSDQDMGDILVR